MSSNIITALDGIISVLGSQSYLTDPLPNSTLEEPRDWVHSDIPLPSATYPRIQVTKLRTDITKISYGHKNYCDKEDGFFNIYFYARKDFRYPDQGDTYYKNERLVEYYLGSIKECLKKASAQAYMEDRNIHAFVGGETSNIIYNPETKLYCGCLVVRYHWYTL